MLYFSYSPWPPHSFADPSSIDWQNARFLIYSMIRQYFAAIGKKANTQKHSEPVRIVLIFWGNAVFDRDPDQE